MNKKGFTLIELLAVIIILAIIALIAVPQVIKIINQASQKVAENSSAGILKAAESYVGVYMLENDGDWAGKIVFTCNGKKCAGTLGTGEDAKEVTLEFKGTIPDEGEVTLGDNGVASITKALKVNGYTCSEDKDTAGKVNCNKGETTTTSSTQAAAGA